MQPTIHFTKHSLCFAWGREIFVTRTLSAQATPTVDPPRTSVPRNKSGEKVCVTAVVRINPGTLIVYITVERIKRGHQTETVHLYPHPPTIKATDVDPSRRLQRANTELSTCDPAPEAQRSQYELSIPIS
ncbi:hypothetical protein GEV33_007689 [Tenebrio molitor]|uniref:Uncharacterized protein n=1 Tax=Tenebrio molitor TaxID=7067 RepID=A0A8J6HIU7_TENMO|nr:hypothetical protein GEV33_007689 [Tenebrio molitor]